MSGRSKLFAPLKLSLLAMAVGFASGATADEQSLRDELDALSKRIDELSREAKTPDRADSKWHLAGYMDAGYLVTDSNDEEDHFFSGHFNPGFHFQYKDRVFFESELEIGTEEDGSTHVAIEYSNLNVILNDHATLVVGKWLSPVGQFQERLHPSWINRMATAPVGFGHGGVQPLSDVGLQLRGSLDPRVTYVVAVGNGPRLGHHGAELEGFPDDNNSDKSIAGRFGFFPLPDLEVGASYLTASAPGEAADTGPVTEADFDLYGIDTAYTKGAWDVRAEYLSAEMSSHFGKLGHNDASTSLIPGTDWTAWYAQAAYRIPDTRLEPTVRYGELDIDGHFEGDGEERIDVGLNYWMAPSAVARVNVQRREFDEAGADDETRGIVQFAYGF